MLSLPPVFEQMATSTSGGSDVTSRSTESRKLDSCVRYRNGEPSCSDLIPDPLQETPSQRGAFPIKRHRTTNQEQTGIQ